VKERGGALWLSAPGLENGEIEGSNPTGAISFFERERDREREREKERY
jgi:hypothetical protein